MGEYVTKVLTPDTLYSKLGIDNQKLPLDTHRAGHILYKVTCVSWYIHLLLHLQLLFGWVTNMGNA